MKDLLSNAYNDWSYAELIASMEVTVVHEGDLGCYEGDKIFVLTDGLQYGYLTFGYGSCSGCDTLAACNSMAEATELRDKLHGEIHWEPTAADLLAWMDAKDWALDWTYYEAEFKTFLAEAKAKLVQLVISQDGTR